MSSYKTIVKIPEASGICYMEKTDTFFVVDDEGGVFEINKKGKILNKKVIGNHDFEGIFCYENDLFVLIEDTGKILKLSSKDFEIIGEYKLDLSKKERKKYFSENKGAEGLVFDGEYFYLSMQNNKNNLLKFSVKKDKLILEKIIDIKFDDLSGLTLLGQDLYILSDKNNLILKYDLKNEKIIKKIKLEKGAWEGITFGKKGDIFLADDNGRVVML